MKRITPATVALLLSAFLAGGGGMGYAQDPDRAAKVSAAAKDAFKRMLARSDKNRDGKLSRTEFYAIFNDKSKADKNFKIWDLNQDGFITEEEYVKGIASMGRPKK
jgi:Ca2+-binding EF-hand superfamily protein